MRSIYIIMCCIVVLLCGIVGITYSYEFNENSLIKFELKGDYILNLSLYDKYTEYGVNVSYNGEDISSSVNIDDSMVDMSRVGNYKVKYSVNMNGVEEYIYRMVNVTENIKPKIILKGDKMIYLNVNDKYIEPGYEVSDNYDTDLSSRIIITSNLDVSKTGEYNIEYKVSDSSGNVTIVNREIIVK